MYVPGPRYGGTVESWYAGLVSYLTHMYGSVDQELFDFFATHFARGYIVPKQYRVIIPTALRPGERLSQAANNLAFRYQWRATWAFDWVLCSSELALAGELRFPHGPLLARSECV